jgi:hypothetical protein
MWMIYAGDRILKQRTNISKLPWTKFVYCEITLKRFWRVLPGMIVSPLIFRGSPVLLELPSYAADFLTPDQTQSITKSLIGNK